MRTHTLIHYHDHVAVIGNGNYFSWILEYKFGEWDLSTIYGRHKGTFKTIGQALRSIGCYS
jgi:hypothetical protein